MICSVVRMVKVLSLPVFSLVKNIILIIKQLKWWKIKSNKLHREDLECKHYYGQKSLFFNDIFSLQIQILLKTCKFCDLNLRGKSTCIRLGQKKKSANVSRFVKHYSKCDVILSKAMIIKYKKGHRLFVGGVLVNRWNKLHVFLLYKNERCHYF